MFQLGTVVLQLGAIVLWFVNFSKEAGIVFPGIGVYISNSLFRCTRELKASLKASESFIR